MVEGRVEVSLDGLARLQSAASDFARAEVARIVQAVIDDLRSRPAVGTFGDAVAARHLWDEYCWTLQEGPFDHDMGWDDMRLGSLSGALEEMLRAFIENEVEKLSKHALIFLSAQAFEEDVDSDEEESLGNIWIDGIVNMIAEEVNHRASRRNLDLIGPHRGDVIGYVIEGYGLVWSVLSDRGEAMDLITSQMHTMIDPEFDLSEIAEEMVDGFMAAANEDAEGTLFAGFLERFADDVRSLVRENDVLPSLKKMRAALLERLDG